METRRVLLATALSLGILLAWQAVFPPARAPRPERTLPAEETAPAAASAVGSDATSAAESRAVAPPPATAPTQTLPPIVAANELTVELVDGETRVRISNRGGELVSFEVVPARAERQELLRRRLGSPGALAYVDARGEELPLNRALFAVEQDGPRSVILRYRGELGEAEKRFVLSGPDTFELAATASVPRFGLWLGPGLRDADAKELENHTRNRGVVIGRGKEVETLGVKGNAEARSIDGAGVTFAGLEDLYFLAAVIPQTAFAELRVVPWLVAPSSGEKDRPLAAEAGKEERKRLRDLGLVLVSAGQGITARGFFGAKQYERLRAEGVGLDRTIRWGFFRFLTIPLYHGLQFLHDRVVANYGWCIVLMTMLIRVLLLPLTHTSYVSMQKMQGLNPRMEAIRARYRPRLRDAKGKPNLEMHRKMNEEVQALLRQEGVNPAGGCLPLLAQIPVFFSFFYLLQGAVELWRAPWILWIKDLSAPDPTTVVLPVIMGATQFLSQRLMPAPPNQAQRILINTMPIWFTFFSLGFPSGLVLYWMTNNVLTMVQQWFYNRLKRRKDGGARGK